MHHDRSYKLIFSNPEMIRDLFIGFIDEPWVADVDFSTLERESNSYVTDDLRERMDDIIWRVKIKGQPVYVVILLEFQSKVDPFMALRIMGYLALLYQDIIAADRLLPNGNLPPVFPIVLYNGRATWRAKRNVDELIEQFPGGLLAYMPHLRYFLLEIGEVDESAPFLLKNLAAALVRLEKSRDPQMMIETIRELTDWLTSPARTRLRRSFTVWIRRVLLPSRLPGVTSVEIGNILEEKTMLAERISEWTTQWRAEGLQQGLQQGMQQGLQQGMSTGMLQGQSKVLQRQLTARFGPLPEWALARLRDAGEAELENWSLQVLSGPGLNEILA
jgi:Putative transposase, YhgA-like